MITRCYRLIACLLLVLCCSTVTAAPPPPAPGPGDKCPVCGMFVKKYPSWVAMARLRDGRYLYFDGAKDLFRYLQAPVKYRPSPTTPPVEQALVKDYYSLQVIDAKQAYFVMGSDVYGPMGHELIPFAKLPDAQEFQRDHHGKRIIRFHEINQGILTTLE